MSDQVVGAIKGGIAGGLRGGLCGMALAACASVVVARGPVGWFGWALTWTAGQCVSAAPFVGAAMGAGRGFITKGNRIPLAVREAVHWVAPQDM